MDLSEEKVDTVAPNFNHSALLQDIKADLVADIFNSLELTEEIKVDMVNRTMNRLDFSDKIKADMTANILSGLKSVEEDEADRNDSTECSDEPDCQEGFVMQEMMTGSILQGEVNALNMNGGVRYSMPHGVVFEGVMQDGMFQGDGVLRYPTGAALHGTWDQGRLVHTSKYVYRDGLTRTLDMSGTEDEFHYCEANDRRFYRETRKGIASCNDEYCPRVIPGNYYDVGDGFLDLTVNWVLDPDTLEPKRHADAETIARAMRESRRGWHEYSDSDKSELRDITGDQINLTKVYKHVPGLDLLKKNYKLERKLNILRYKIDHNIATTEDLDTFERLMSDNTLNMVSDDKISDKISLPVTQLDHEAENILSSTTLFG